jgi:gamma-glutamyltranspeptidase/glutathione hydrolase
VICSKKAQACCKNEGVNMYKPIRQPGLISYLGLLGIAAFALLGSCTTVPVAQAERAPAQIFVAAAHPLAAEAGLAVLRRGGSAVDAAIAVQAMLSLVEPQSSGLGGGAFLNHYDASSRSVTVYDGRETAPAGASAGMFLGADGKALPMDQAMLSGRATGVPGVVRMLKLAHDEHGRLNWSSLFGDAERSAREGFIVSNRLGRFVSSNAPQATTPDARAYFSQANGNLVKTGDTLRNPAFADFLRRLSARGPDVLYKGPTAERIVARTRAGPLGGSMTLDDLARYAPVKREPLCRTYRIHILCVPPPPSSGVALLQVMAILDRTDIASRGRADPQAWFLFAEASRLMYADRDRYVADPAFAKVPVQGLLDPTYVASRAALIGPAAGAPPVAGTPPGASVAALDRTLEPVGTSHFVIVDSRGNAVSMTTTVESLFGSGRMVDGMFLNNQMTDFSLQPTDDQGRLVPNAVGPGKRPRSSMTPVIIMDQQRRLTGAVGSPGGSAILAYVAKALLGSLAWNLPMQEAINLPNLVARGSAFNGESGKMPPAVLEGLRARGVVVRPGSGEDSGLHGVAIRSGRFDGGADLRRDGVARAETAQR